MARIVRLLLVLLLAIGLDAAPASAQLSPPKAEPKVALPDPLTPEAVRALVARLSDAEVRTLLLNRLDAEATKKKSADKSFERGILDLARRATVGTFESVSGAVERLPVLWDLQLKSFRTFYDRVGLEGMKIMLIVLTFAIAAGLAVEMLFRRITLRWVESSAATESATLWGTLLFLLKRLTQDILSVVIFLYVAQRAGIWFGLSVFGDVPVAHKLGGYMGLIWVNLLAVPRLAAAFSRFLLAPRRPEFRLLATDDDTALYLHRHNVGIMLLSGLSIAIVYFNAFNGVTMGESRLGFWLNLLVHLYIIVIAWRAWDGLVMLARGHGADLTPTEEWVARIYPRFVIGVSIGTWVLVNILVSYKLFALLQQAPHYKMMVILIFLPAMETGVRGLVRHLVPPMRGEGPLAEKAWHAARRSYIRIGRVVVFAAVIWAIARIWQIDLADVTAMTAGMKLAAGIIEFLFILAIGYLFWELVSLWLNRRLAAEQTAAGHDPSQDEIGGEGGGSGGSRLSTVLPLVMGVLKVAIFTIFLLIALGNVGIDITPLLAGAGIVGLAIGFGAQKLVTDVVSGIFFLVDDAFRTGEYVEVDGTFGTVEKISLRSMQLRHHKGAVHTIPYGEIPKLTNYSRDWVIMKMRFTVPFETDPNKVKKIFKQIGKDMMEVPEFAADLLQPFKSQGVFDFDDVGMIIRGKFMAKPGRQFVLRKEIFNRVKAAFERNGIQFARREVRVALPEGAGPLTEDDKAAIAAAAGETAKPDEAAALGDKT